MNDVDTVPRILPNYIFNFMKNIYTKNTSKIKICLWNPTEEVWVCFAEAVSHKLFFINGWLYRFRNPFVTRVEGEPTDDSKTCLDNWETSRIYGSRIHMAQ